ncbi:hypothetical protein SAMN05443999_10279 [Roseovarius azorensis]|uniref:Uncharacterized protein n=1 Tax=Roseovarius azorensis TaxID=1287727 RepID=A0A1H7J5Y4_9RHOB|nr:UPF0280 family protein [Roseovarius azorensis]SEK69287.1 hypothetical protein SAMN05443999_10279 [Roseovarius azorensis]
MSGVQAAWLSGGRLHLHHGPIDMIVGAEGPGREAGLARAAGAFGGVLQGLVEELPRLRADAGPMPRGAVARRMVAAVAPFAPEFITPMAAVAGAGAEAVLAALCNGPGIGRAYVNNGGDVAFHLGTGQEMRAAGVAGLVRIGTDDPWRGVATSGQGGRSLSLGIAESVTVLARGAALADAAATMIANRVDLPGHAAILRVPACEVAPDSDLGARLVVRHVGPLTPDEVAQALDRGTDYAQGLRMRGLIGGAMLALRGQMRIVGDLPLVTSQEKEAVNA